MNLILKDLSKKLIGGALQVHKTLGPGFIESIYETAPCVELRYLRMRFEKQKSINLHYRNMPVGIHRIDLIVENQIIVELKTVDTFERIHFAQIKSYLKATSLKLGLLLNFNNPVFRGIAFCSLIF